MAQPQVPQPGARALPKSNDPKKRPCSITRAAPGLASDAEQLASKVDAAGRSVRGHPKGPRDARSRHDGARSEPCQSRGGGRHQQPVPGADGCFCRYRARILSSLHCENLRALSQLALQLMFVVLDCKLGKQYDKLTVIFRNFFFSMGYKAEDMTSFGETDRLDLQVIKLSLHCHYHKLPAKTPLHASYFIDWWRV